MGAMKLCKIGETPPDGAWIVVSERSKKARPGAKPEIMSLSGILGYFDTEADAQKTAEGRNIGMFQELGVTWRAEQVSHAFLSSFAGGKYASMGSRGLAQIICPHCQVRGKVETKRVTVKTGLGGGKVVAVLMTGGLTAVTPGIGLSNKRKMTEANCANCGSVWQF